MEHRRKSISTILMLFALAAAFIFAAAFAVPAAAENGGEIPERDLYEFSIQAMEEGRSLRVWGLMRLTYVNRARIRFTALYCACTRTTLRPTAWP